MDQFRTILKISPSAEKINYHSHCLFIGSCFTESIGNYLRELKFQTQINPFGIVYNPLSISNSIDTLLNGKNFTGNDLEFQNDVWFSFRHHSRFSDSDKNSCLLKINEALKTSSEFIKKIDFLFVTFGTSFIYTHIEKNIVVANCHKLPSNVFTKSMLEPEAIITSWCNTIKKIKSINPSVKIIFTVSPVRHINDGITENQQSKSVLFVAIQNILKKFDNCFYFPAYEIMMDELRDYRFYDEDMVHPNDTAINYIRQKFTETYIDQASQEIMAEIKKLLLAKNHKPFFPGTPAHGNFIKKNLQKISELIKQFPFLELDEFKNYFRSFN